ncbi:hypothetical protein CsSME_00036053 [Camellia sinensis var. sinensis]
MMWRSLCIFLKQSLSSAIRYKPKPSLGLRALCWDANGGGGSGGGDVVRGGRADNNSMSFVEVKKLIKLGNVEVLKIKC